MDFFFLLFISTLSHILVSANCPRADKSLSLPLLPGLFLILCQHIPVTHSFVCLFFHLQLLPPPKNWLAQGNYSDLFHFKCIQRGILIVSFHLEQHPHLEFVKNWRRRFRMYLLQSFTTFNAGNSDICIISFPCLSFTYMTWIKSCFGQGPTHSLWP